MLKLKRIALFLAGTALAATPQFSEAAETLKIGVTQPLTGAVAASGNYVVQGAKIAESFLNSSGGLLGKKVQLIIEDNKSNPKEAEGTTPNDDKGTATSTEIDKNQASEVPEKPKTTFQSLSYRVLGLSLLVQ